MQRISLMTIPQQRIFLPWRKKDYRPEKNGAHGSEHWGNNQHSIISASYDNKGLHWRQIGNGDAPDMGTYNMQSADTYDCNYQYDGTAGDG